MDSDRFDRWAKLLALRMSRRTAAAAVGAATVTSLSSPRWALGQDDDDTDDDQNTDDQGGDDAGDESSDGNVDFPNPCLDLTRCARYQCNSNVNPDGSGECHFEDVGPIPDGPYPQALTLAIPPCQPTTISMGELEAKCNAAYPGKNCHKCCSVDPYGDNICQACADFSLAFCH